MRRAALSAALWVAATPVAAQPRPDLSGTWTRVVDSAAARSTVATTGDAAFRRGDMGSGWGAPLTIVQRPDSLIVSYVHFSAYDLQPPVRFAYALDGSETRNALMIGHAASVQRSRVTWAGDTLVITTRHAVPDAQPIAGTDVRQALVLSGPNTLVIATTRMSVLDGPTTTTRTVYTRP